MFIFVDIPSYCIEEVESGCVVVFDMTCTTYFFHIIPCIAFDCRIGGTSVCLKVYRRLSFITDRVLSCIKKEVVSRVMVDTNTKGSQNNCGPHYDVQGSSQIHRARHEIIHTPFVHSKQTDIRTFFPILR